jgi:hypothetical protein
MFEPAKLQMNCANASGSTNLRADPSGRCESVRATTAAFSDKSVLTDQIRLCDAVAQN